MNRSTVAALVAAAVVGVTGGTVSAVVRDPAGARAGAPEPTAPTTSAAASPSATPRATPTASGPASPTATPSASPSGTAAPDPDPETNEPLLWLGGGVLHDGQTTVRFTRTGRVERLVRVEGGWMIATATGAEGRSNLWYLATDGSTSKLAIVTAWDTDAQGTQVVGTEASLGQVQVWSLPTLDSTAVYATEGNPTLVPAWAGSEVLISQDTGDRVDLVRWDPGTKKSTIVGAGVRDLSLSPGGSYLAGTTGTDGVVDPGGPNPCLHVSSTFLKKQTVDWRTCDWQPIGGAARFSPDGTRLLAEPLDTDGFGPGEIGIFDASDGPRTMVGSFRTPANTVDAEWADNDHLYLWGSTTFEPESSATWIKRCDLSGTCTQVVTSRGLLAVGSGT